MGNALRKRRPREYNSIVGSVDRESQARLNEEEGGCGSPGLGCAGNRIKRRAFSLATLDSAKKFRQPMEFQIAADVHQCEQELAREVLETIARQACCDHGVIVRPYRTVVVRQRV